MNRKRESGLDELKKDIASKSPKKSVVHATFRLSQKAHGAIKEAAQVLGLKYAEFFDKLLMLFEGLEEGKSPISLAAEENAVTTRKAYVVHKATLAKLRRIVEGKKTTRDLVIGNTALKFLSFMQESESEKKDKYRRILERELNPLSNKARDIERKLIEGLGSGDPLAARFGFVITALTNLSTAIESHLKEGTPVDPDDFSQRD
jgi:hypothetical protein